MRAVRTCTIGADGLRYCGMSLGAYIAQLGRSTQAAVIQQSQFVVSVMSIFNGLMCGSEALTHAAHGALNATDSCAPCVLQVVAIAPPRRPRVTYLGRLLEEQGAAEVRLARYHPLAVWPLLRPFAFAHRF